jgi:hypothetical protein
MGRRGLVIVASGVAFATFPAGASASVLVAAPHPFTKSCGARIDVGVWWRDDGQPTARKVRISIRTRSGKLLWRKRVRATRQWRNWRYKPDCGRRYVVRYRNAVWGVQRFNVRVRPGS